MSQSYDAATRISSASVVSSPVDGPTSSAAMAPLSVSRQTSASMQGAMQPPAPPSAQQAQRKQQSGRQIKRLTLTSKKNWWLVELDRDEESTAHGAPTSSTHSWATASSASDNTAMTEVLPSLHPTPRQLHTTTPTLYDHDEKLPTPPPSPPIYNPPRNPSSIFSFPTPTAYAAPPNPTGSLAPFANGSASELFRCIVKKPEVVQLELNGEMQSNATDVTTQFLAELRVYTTLARHRNITAFLGCLENVGMVLEFIDGRTLYDVLREHERRFVDCGHDRAQAMARAVKVDYHDQLLAGLTHLHAYGLSHGDLSLLNIQVTHTGNTVKLLDFGRSVAADSILRPPDEEPADPFVRIPQSHKQASSTPTIAGRQPLVEQIHPGTRPFAAPEVLRGECTDARLADAYSFGMILVCLDRCTAPGVNKSWTLEDVKPWTQRRDQLPTGFFDGCAVFGVRAREWYVRPWAERKRLLEKDEIGNGASTDGDVDMG